MTVVAGYRVLRHPLRGGLGYRRQRIPSSGGMPRPKRPKGADAQPDQREREGKLLLGDWGRRERCRNDSGARQSA